MTYNPSNHGLLLAFLLTLLACNNAADQVHEERLPLTKDMAEQLAVLPLKCLQREFPNKPNQVLNEAAELGLPQQLHPAFYGCFDWHSSVHGHWMLLELLRDFPDLSQADRIRATIQENMSAANIEAEVAYFMRPGEKSFERTYGWAWLLKMDEVLLKSKDSVSLQLHRNLTPLVDLIVDRFIEFLPRLNNPIRIGEHPNTAFGLSLAYDYAVTAHHEPLQQMIKQRAIDYYFQDVDCPLTWEPSGYDFLSPCLQEAALMSKILEADEFRKWLNLFLPNLKNPNFALNPARVSDRNDGKLVHLDGLNFCRAWSLYAIAEVLPEYNHLISIANNHINASLTEIIDGSYEGEHWLASFALLALKKNEK